MSDARLERDLGLEPDDALGRDVDRRSGHGIATDAPVAHLGREASEPGDPHVLATLEQRRGAGEHGVDRPACLAFGLERGIVAGQFGQKSFFRHIYLRSADFHHFRRRWTETAIHWLESVSRWCWITSRAISCSSAAIPAMYGFSSVSNPSRSSIVVISARSLRRLTM